MDKLRTSMVAAVSSSIALICMLMIFVPSATKESKSEIWKVVLVLAILLLTVSTIVQWVKYLKQYVDFAIAQNLREINKKPEE